MESIVQCGNTVEQVGQFEMQVVAGENASDSNDRWSRRSQAIANWLASEWQREQASISQGKQR